MRAKLWDESAGDYSEVDVPDGCMHLGHDLEAMVTCPSCGKKVKYGSCYASHRFFVPKGIWALAVCPACHERERELMEGVDE